MWLLLACLSDPPPGGKDVVIVGGAALDAQGRPVATAAAGPTFDEVAVPCCGASEAVLEAYLQAAEALARDDAASAQAALRRLSELPEAGELGLLAAPLATAELKPLREGFRGLSMAMAAFVRRQDPGGQRIAAVWCPMAPGWWLQRAPEVQNPYHGGEMLRCGTFEPLDRVRP